jgi:hypothetical protein
MKKTLTPITLVASLVLAACAGSPAVISGASPAELKQYNNAQLCLTYFTSGQETRARMKAELDSRQAFPATLWPAIDAKQVSIGMPEAAVLCSWGRPDDVNTSTSAYGTRKQLVYRRGASQRQYIYTTNGVVESTSSN